jgi:hypothetical protein
MCFVHQCKTFVLPSERNFYIFHLKPFFLPYLTELMVIVIVIVIVILLRSIHRSFPMRKYIRGSFQKFCTLYVFSLKINLFYKIHLQAFNVISIVLYHSGPAFGQVLYSCLDAFVFDVSDYSRHLIRNLHSASEAFPTEWFLQFLGTSQSVVCSAQNFWNDPSICSIISTYVTR